VNLSEPPHWKTRKPPVDPCSPAHLTKEKIGSDRDTEKSQFLYLDSILFTENYVEMRNTSIVRSMSSVVKICRCQDELSFSSKKLTQSGESQATHLDPVDESTDVV
jgi:hypothetical protein